MKFKMSIRKCFRIFLNFYSKFLIWLILIFKLLITKLYKCFTVIKSFLITNRLSIIQVICISFMIYNAFVLISEYLKFGYELKLIFSNNNRGIDLPAISVCTESNVLFDRRKVIQYFDLSREYSELENGFNGTKNCKPKNRGKYAHDNLWSLRFCFLRYNDDKINELRIFLIKYELMIFEHLSYEQMIAFIISSDELFECSASLHYMNQTIESNATIIEKCSERFRISRDIYANNDFGICYKFFDNNYGINIKNDDIIVIKIKYETQNKFMFNVVNLPKLEEFFSLYYFSDDNTYHLQNKDNAIELRHEYGLKSDLLFKTVTLEMLSTPYMEFCQQKGKNINNYIIQSKYLFQ